MILDEMKQYGISDELIESAKKGYEFSKSNLDDDENNGGTLLDNIISNSQNEEKESDVNNTAEENAGTDDNKAQDEENTEEKQEQNEEHQDKDEKPVINLEDAKINNEEDPNTPEEETTEPLFNMETLREEFMENKGQFTEETVNKLGEALGKLGFDSNIVNDYMNLKMEHDKRLVTDIKSGFGDNEETIDNVINWAKSTSKGNVEIRGLSSAYNAAVNSGDISEAKEYAKLIADRYNSANKKTVNIQGNVSGDTQSNDYNDLQSDIMNDIKNKVDINTIIQKGIKSMLKNNK